MRLKIENFGPVKECEVNQKPLTIFVGPNATGKTWSSSLIALLFSPFMWARYYDAYSKGKLTEVYDFIDDSIQELIVKGSSKVNIKSFFELYGEEYINNVASLSPIAVNELFGSQNYSFDDLKFTIQFDENAKDFMTENKTYIFNTRLGVNEDGDELLKIYTQENDSTMYMLTRSKNILEHMPKSLIKEEIVKRIFQATHRTFYNNTYFFPAERTGLVPFLDMFNANNKKDKVTKTEYVPKEDRKVLPLALASLLGVLGESCDLKNQQNRLDLAKNDHLVKKYIELSELLEKEILGGSIETSILPDGSVDISFKVKDENLIFEISSISSSVKDLMFLVLYLRYVAEGNDLILIDEPEMNLHPEAQLKIMELLTLMVNNGINVIVTTHSPYLVDHVSNLTKAYNLKIKGVQGIENKFKLQSEDSFIDPKDISVYLFENGTAKDILKENGLIDWQTFSDISEYVSNLYFEMGD